MEINNFLDVLGQIKQHYKWQNECIITFSKDMKSVYVDGVFVPRPLAMYDYIMPLLRVKEEGGPWCPWRFFGCYDNRGCACVVRIFIGGNTWQLKNVEVRNVIYRLVMDGYLKFQFENESTKEIRNVEIKNSVILDSAFAEQLSAQIREELSE